MGERMSSTLNALRMGAKVKKEIFMACAKKSQALHGKIWTGRFRESFF